MTRIDLGRMVVDRRGFLTGVAAGALGTMALREAALCRSPGSEDELVFLAGTAGDIGRQFGRINAADIREHVEEMFAGWRKQGLTHEQAVERSQPFIRFATKFAPHWLEEAAACAEAAGTRPEQYVAYQAGKYRSLFFTDDCTSFAAAGEATSDGATIFHKNRDNATRSQSAWYRRTEGVPGVAGFYGTGDTSDLGTMMMVNDHGLAGSADMGGLKETHPKCRGVMNPFILRLIAERAERCEDALEIIQETIRDGWYAGGKTAGTHWLFADRYGTILRVAQNSVEEQHWFHRDTTVFLARGNTAGANAFNARRGKLEIRDFHEAAQCTDICFGSSISALTVRIDPDTAIAGSTVWFALPAWGPFVPLHTATAGVPGAMVDGRFFEAGFPLLELRLTGENKDAGFGKRLTFSDSYIASRRALQESLYEGAEAAEAQIRNLLANNDQKSAAEIANRANLAAWERCSEWYSQVQHG